MSSLLREVSQGELTQMRDSGMSNYEIAKSLDVSYATVLRLIGKQPSGMRKQMTKRTDVAVISALPNDTSPEPCLSVAGKSLSLTGDFAQYFLDLANDQLTIKADEHLLNMGLDKIGALINELSAIQRKLPLINASNEMW